MAGKNYDEETRRLARVIYCRSDYRNRAWQIEQMRAEEPGQYETLQRSTVANWKKQDKKNGIDWDELRRQKQIQRAAREGSLAVNTAEEILDKILVDMLGVVERIRKLLERKEVLRVGAAEHDENGEKNEDAAIEFIPDFKRLLDAYMKAADRALKLVQGKVKEVDLSRLSKENQVIFLRRVFEDIGLVAKEIDEDFGRDWKKNEKSLLARMRSIYGDEIITEVQDDLCLDTIIERKRELDARRSSQGNTDQGATPGVYGRGPGGS